MEISSYIVPGLVGLAGLYGLFNNTLRNYDPRMGLETDEDNQEFKDSLRKQTIGWKLGVMGYSSMSILGLLFLGGLIGFRGAYI